MSDKIAAIALRLEVNEDPRHYGYYSGDDTVNRFAALPDAYHARNIRVNAGWTSIRIDKNTAEKLRELARSLPKMINRHGDMKLVELFTVIAGGSLETVHAQTPAVKHARVSSAKKHARARGKKAVRK